jgi:predicted DNA-binding transcriptional regulator YafY
MTQYEKKIMDILTIAMKGNNLIEFLYDNNTRIVEPYLFGELFNKNDKNHFVEGKYALKAWFVRGYTSLSIDIKEGDRWKLYHIDKIVELKILDEKDFTIRPFYNPDDKDFKRINFRIAQSSQKNN